MKIAVCTPQELDQSHIDQWRTWQTGNPRTNNGFLTPEFAIAFGRHNTKARVGVIEQDGVVRGFFPFMQLALRAGKSFAYDIADHQALICDPDFEWDLDAVLRATGIDIFEFDHLIETQSSELSGVDLAPSPVIDLTPGWDSWITAKRASQSRVKRLSSRSRQLEKALGPLTFDLDCKSEEDLALLRNWKSAQYIRTGRSDRFARSWFNGFVDELFATRTEHFALPLARLQAGGKTIALSLGPQSGGEVAAWFPVYDVEYSNFSPGTVCLLEQVRAGAETGLTSIDLGKGFGTYKEAFKDHDAQVGEGLVHRGGPYAFARRAGTAPKRAAFALVLNNERLRTGARSALNGVGKVRTKLGR